MKNLLKVAAVAFCMTLMGNFAKAQGQKIGYIARDQLIPLLPEYKTAETAIANASTDWTNQINKLGQEYQDKGKAYEAKRATMTEAARTVAESELADLQKRYQDLNTKAGQDIETKKDAQLQPLLTKINVAVSAVAKEKGYVYVINSTNTELLVAPDADNLLVPVKAKLGLK